jgi:two-component system, OmpR family, sensor histidine kinase MprB
MSLRRRIAFTAAGAVAVAVVLGSIVAYVVVRDTLRSQIDASLQRVPPPEIGERFTARVPPGVDPRTDPLEDTVVFAQLVEGDRLIASAGEQRRLGDPDEVQAVADGRRGAFFSDEDVDGTRVRVLTQRAGPNLAIQLARPLTEVDDALAKMRLGLALGSLAVIALAAFLARYATRHAVKPVTDLTETAEHVARTRDLSRRIEAEGGDELSRLAASFNTMLEALDESMRAQRQLVADASHELRTPLTSLRTNIEVLAEEEELQPDDRARLLRDVVGQLQELTLLVGDLVDLARGDEPLREREDLRLDALVEQTVERARRRHPEREFVVTVEPAIVNGVPSRIDRAVANLLDNAVKWGPPGDPVEVRVENGEVSVRDHGPGFSESDLPLVFDRFYRAPAARGLPGSGLGLAIVRQVAESHGGRASAENAPDGGARLRLRLSRNGDSAASVASAASGRT